MTMTFIKVHIRWCVRRDMPDVLAIEKASSVAPCSEEAFLAINRERHTITKVAEIGDRTLGFVTYRLHGKLHAEILNIAVDPVMRRNQIGLQLIDSLKRVPGRKIEAIIGEHNTGTHLFFQAMEFKAVKVLRRHLVEPDEDGYLFRWESPDADDGSSGEP